MLHSPVPQYRAVPARQPQSPVPQHRQLPANPIRLTPASPTVQHRTFEGVPPSPQLRQQAHVQHVPTSPAWHYPPSAAARVLTPSSPICLLYTSPSPRDRG
eukprot:3044403-Amphidinium_carterae.1